jgi:hypothetical protein
MWVVGRCPAIASMTRSSCGPSAATASTCPFNRQVEAATARARRVRALLLNRKCRILMVHAYNGPVHLEILFYYRFYYRFVASRDTRRFPEFIYIKKQNNTKQVNITLTTEIVCERLLYLSGAEAAYWV